MAWRAVSASLQGEVDPGQTRPHFFVLLFLPPPFFLLFLSLLYTHHFVSPPQLSSALLFDAVYAVVTAVQELNRSQEIGVKPLSCGSAQIWQHGTSLMNYLRMVSRERGGPRGRGSLPRARGHSLCPPAPRSLCLRHRSPPPCSLWPRPSSVCAVLSPFLCPASSPFPCGPSWSLSLSLSLSSPPSGPLPPLPLPSSRPAR